MGDVMLWVWAGLGWAAYFVAVNQLEKAYNQTRDAYVEVIELQAQVQLERWIAAGMRPDDAEALKQAMLAAVKTRFDDAVSHWWHALMPRWWKNRARKPVHPDRADFL